MMDVAKVRNEKKQSRVKMISRIQASKPPYIMKMDRPVDCFQDSERSPNSCNPYISDAANPRRRRLCSYTEHLDLLVDENQTQHYFSSSLSLPPTPSTTAFIWSKILFFPCCFRFWLFICLFIDGGTDLGLF